MKLGWCLNAGHSNTSNCESERSRCVEPHSTASFSRSGLCWR
jgi:hypothetical protein